MSDNIYQFAIPGFSTTREWSVYIIVAKNASSADKYLYVGKVGDNRDGCNPIISRIGNHLSLNKVHSQMRNKLTAKGYSPSDFNYIICYATFGEYDQTKHNSDRDRINEMERRLNQVLQEKLKLVAQQVSYELLNPLGGKYLPNKAERDRREKLLIEEDSNTLEKLAEQALSFN
jgi:hypothetical protein